MKFIVNSKELLDRLQKLGKAINPKNTLPILNCFLFEVKGSRLYLVGSDQEARMSTSIDISEVEGAGKIAVNAQIILGALKDLPEQPIILEINENNLEVVLHYQNGKHNFIGLNGDEYPEPNLSSEIVKQKLKISPVDLHNAINGTLFASADDELRPVMNGVYFDIDTDKTIFVASDGHKLIKLESLICGESKSSFILPKKGARIVLDLVSKESDDVIINYDLNNATFKIGEYALNIRFIEGRYPNYNSVIPQNQPLMVEINKELLTSIIKRVSVFGNKESNLVVLDVSNNAITVTAQDIDYSTASEESAEIDYSGEPIKIGFKSMFLVELLKNISSENVILSFSDPSRACVIVPSQNSFNFKQTSLIMPMMLND